MAEKTYTIAEIYAAIIGEDVEFDELLAKEALSAAAETLSNMASDEITHPMPDVNDIRSHAKLFTEEQLTGFVKNVSKLIDNQQMTATISRKIEINVAF